EQQRFDAVITDMRLPDGLGLDLLQRMASQQRPERCVVMTPSGSAENAVEALKAGAYDYLTKPVDLKQFRAVVASALGGAPATVPTMVPSSPPSETATVATAASVIRAPRPSPPAPAPVSQALSRMAGN